MLCRIYVLWLKTVYRFKLGKGWVFKGRPFVRVGGRDSKIERIHNRCEKLLKMQGGYTNADYGCKGTEDYKRG